MKRKILSAVLILCMLAAFVPCGASAETGTKYDDYLYYKVNADGAGVTITDCDSNASGEIVIPDEIDDLPVTSIGDNAFMNCKKLTNITLPQDLTYIGDHAFSGCSAWEGELTIPEGVASISNSVFMNCEKLTKITLPQNLTYIGDDAFCQCYAWEGELTIPEGVTSINNCAFKSCKKLTKITLPQNVASIGEDVFYQCFNLAQISLASDNAFFTLQDGVLFNKDKTVLIKYPEGTGSRETYTVPDGVKELSIHALANCYYIPEIILPESLETIGEEAFEDCNKLTEITIPAGVTTIYSNPFSGCDNLKDISVDENSQDFCGENGVLFDKNKTRLIQYPSGKDNAEYSVPNTVSEISEYAFCYCKYLEYINIPDSVTNIDIGAFQSCKKLTSVTIPNSVESISDFAFVLCSALQDVTIPKSVTDIGFRSFDGCTALTDVYYGGSETDWENIDIKTTNKPLTSAHIHYNYVRTDPDTYAISDIQAASGGVELTVQSNKSVSGEQVVFAAYYGADGAFLGMEAKPVAYSETEQTVTFDGNSDAKTVKAFVWNALEYMMPASAAATVQIV